MAGKKDKQAKKPPVEDYVGKFVGGALGVLFMLWLFGVLWDAVFTSWPW